MADELLQAIRLQNAILRVGFKAQLESLASEIHADAVSSAIVTYLAENSPSKSGALKQAVAKRVPQGTDVSDTTIKRRLASLENRGVITKTGQAASTEYELTELVT